MKKFLKCVLWFVKEYANVGIALALFMLIGLQIEQQYRSVRYFENCMEQSFNKDLKYYEKVEHCSDVKSDDVSSFNYHRGITREYLKK